MVGVRARVSVSCVRGFLNSVEGHLKQGQGEDPDSARSPASLEVELLASLHTRAPHPLRSPHPTVLTASALWAAIRLHFSVQRYSVSRLCSTGLRARAVATSGVLCGSSRRGVKLAKLRAVRTARAVRRAARRAAVGGGLRRGCARRGGRLAAGRAIRRVWGDEEDLDGPRLRLEVDLISPLPRLHPLIRVGHLQRGSRRRLDGDDRVGGERGDVADVLVCDKGMLLVRRVLRQRA
mmetsp:Transcript_42129/g.137223  ORF Transcript_42129/g.137223 Transcript_42129/m.137223 type:complete len:236 (-) Transcript_42129:350-1057(-)